MEAVVNKDDKTYLQTNEKVREYKDGSLETLAIWFQKEQLKTALFVSRLFTEKRALY